MIGFYLNLMPHLRISHYSFGVKQNPIVYTKLGRENRHLKIYLYGIKLLVPMWDIWEKQEISNNGCLWGVGPGNSVWEGVFSFKIHLGYLNFSFTILKVQFKVSLKNSSTLLNVIDIQKLYIFNAYSLPNLEISIPL